MLRVWGPLYKMEGVPGRVPFEGLWEPSILYLRTCTGPTWERDGGDRNMEIFNALRVRFLETPTLKLKVVTPKP